MDVERTGPQSMVTRSGCSSVSAPACRQPAVNSRNSKQNLPSTAVYPSTEAWPTFQVCGAVVVPAGTPAAIASFAAVPASRGPPEPSAGSLAAAMCKSPVVAPAGSSADEGAMVKTVPPAPKVSAIAIQITPTRSSSLGIFMVSSSGT